MDYITKLTPVHFQESQPHSRKTTLCERIQTFERIQTTDPDIDKLTMLCIIVLYVDWDTSLVSNTDCNDKR